MVVAPEAGAFAVERFPPPDFSPGYSYPQSSQAAPAGGWRGWMDLGVLGLARSDMTWVVNDSAGAAVDCG